MGWTTPKDWATGEIVTEATMDAHVRDNLRYLKGLDGDTTLSSGLIIDNTGGVQYLKLPSLTTAQIGTALATSTGRVAYDSTVNRIKFYDSTAIRSVVSTADVDDVPVNAATTDPISSNWAYDQANVVTTTGDMRYATGTGVETRLAAGTSGYVLTAQGAGVAPIYAVSPGITSKLLTFTRDLATATGDVAYTGVGFQPRALIIIGLLSTDVITIGLGDINNAEWSLARSGLDVFGYSTTLIIRIIVSINVNENTASLVSLDADGFTLGWTKLGSPTGTVNLVALCLR